VYSGSILAYLKLSLDRGQSFVEGRRPRAFRKAVPEEPRASHRGRLHKDQLPERGRDVWTGFNGVAGPWKNLGVHVQDSRAQSFGRIHVLVSYQVSLNLLLLNIFTFEI
jgi:hypothetical protein